MSIYTLSTGTCVLANKNVNVEITYNFILLTKQIFQCILCNAIITCLFTVTGVHKTIYYIYLTYVYIIYDKNLPILSFLWANSTPISLLIK